MSGCLFECESALGPPPDLISSMPPPPIPTFLRDPVQFLADRNGTCNLCGWAYGDDVQLVQVIRKYPVLDDFWYIVIVSAAVGAIFIGLLILIVALRWKESKIKPEQQASSGVKLSNAENASTTQVPNPHSNHKLLWSTVQPINKRDSNGSYFLQHQLINPDNILNSNYEKIDYGSIDNSISSVLPAPTRFPINSPPPPPPPLISSQNPNSSVHLTNRGHAYFANPDSLNDGAFDNNAFVDSEVNFRRVKGYRRTSSQPKMVNSRAQTKVRLPHIQSTSSKGGLDHLVIRDSPRITQLPMVTQLHVDPSQGSIRSTALV